MSRLPNLLETSSNTIASMTSERTDAGAGAKTGLLVVNDYRGHRTAPLGISHICRCHPKEVRMAGHVVVVGAGLAGLSAAVHLQGTGRQVTVLEKADAPGGRAGT